MNFANGIGLGLPAINGLGLVLQTACKAMKVYERHVGATLTDVQKPPINIRYRGRADVTRTSHFGSD